MEGPLGIVPENNTGNASNAEEEAQFDSIEQARDFYQVARKRLLTINKWHDYGGWATSNFILTDEAGDPVDREPIVGDHFQIDIPGPGPTSGEGMDWVRIEDVEESDTTVALRVRPCSNPKNQRHDVAHFFAPTATSSFTVELNGKTVKAGVYGRNEKPNTDMETVADTVRNAAIATTAIGGIAKLQWISLVKGILERDDQ